MENESSLKTYIKLVLAFIVHILTRVFCLVPIDRKKIVFEAYMGKQFSCNPKYLCEYISSIYDSYRLLWVYSGNKLNCQYQQIKRNSFKYFYHVLSAGTVVHNSGLNKLLKFRKEQIVINTWHGGGAYKKMSRAITNTYNRKNDYFISSSRLASKYVIRDSQNFQGKILEFGMPRNDMLINEDEKKALIVKEKLKIGNKKTVLYAPTFRDDASKVDFKLDYLGLVKCLHKKFGGEWIILHRSHYHMNGESSNNPEYVIDVTQYPDMQELLLIADILITDYSSAIWDFSFLSRPIFLYATDLEEYDKERSFFVDIHKWGFPICENNEELQRAIEQFEQKKLMQQIETHQNLMGSYETGEASKKLFEFIENAHNSGTIN